MDKNDIIEYVMHTPHNTNRAVLSSMLNQLSDGGDDSGGSWIVLTEESVTTEASGSGLYETSLEYSELITADSVRITLNGVEYTCTNISEESGEGAYGAEIPDWSTYPFRLESSESPFGGVTNHIITETAGTYNIKIEAPQSGGSSDFSTATLTLSNNGTNRAIFKCPYLYNEQIKNDSFLPNDGASVNFSVILYKGNSCDEIVIEDSVTGDALEPSNMSGAVTYDDEEMTYLITGDCTITIGGDANDQE